MTTISLVLSEALSSYNTKQKEELAKQIGVSPRTLAYAIKGETELTIEQLAQVSDFTSIDILNQYLYKIGKNTVPIVKEDEEKYVLQKNYTTIGLTIKGVPASFDNFAAFLEEIKAVATKYNFEI